MMKIVNQIVVFVVTKVLLVARKVPQVIVKLMDLVIMQDQLVLRLVATVIEYCFRNSCFALQIAIITTAATTIN